MPWAMGEAPELSRMEMEAGIQDGSTTDVRLMRKRLGLSQTAFATRFGLSVHAVRQWEQGRRHPDGPARVLLQVISREPEAVRRALDR